MSGSAYTVRQIIVPGGDVVVMRSDLAVPPGCSVVGASEQTVVATISLDASGGVVLTDGSVALPQSNPGVAGRLWDDGGVLAVSAGPPS